MQPTWIPALLLALVGLAGCQGSGGPGGSEILVLDHLSSPPPPPSFSIPVNVTDEDRAAYPVLDRLLGEWEAARGTAAGFSEEYPYEDGLELIRLLQDREPGGYYRAGTVRLAYEGELFDLSALKTHA